MKNKALLTFLFFFVSSFSLGADFWIPEQEDFFDPDIPQLHGTLEAYHSKISLKDLKKLLHRIKEESLLQARTTGFRSQLNWISTGGFHDRGHIMPKSELIHFFKEGYCQSILLQVFDSDPEIKLRQRQFKLQSLGVMLRHNFPNKDYRKNPDYKSIVEEIKLLKKAIDLNQAQYTFEEHMDRYLFIKKQLKKPYEFAKQSDSLRILFDHDHGNLVNGLMSYKDFVDLGLLYLQLKIREEKISHPIQKEEAAHMRDLLGQTLTIWFNSIIVTSLLSIDYLTNTDPNFHPIPEVHKLIASCAPNGLREMIRRGVEFQNSF